jgi:hypothetical protein
MRSVARPRRYLARHWILLARPALRYSITRDAFVLRGVGSSVGPVLRADRRRGGQPRFDGPDRRSAHEHPRALTL